MQTNDICLRGLFTLADLVHRDPPLVQLSAGLHLQSLIMSANKRKEHAEPDLEDIRPDPREHTSNRSARDATGTNPAHTEASEQALNKYSRTVTQPKSQGGSQAMLYATGLTEDDMNKPQVRSVIFRAASMRCHI